LTIVPPTTGLYPLTSLCLWTNNCWQPQAPQPSACSWTSNSWPWKGPNPTPHYLPWWFLRATEKSQTMLTGVKSKSKSILCSSFLDFP
jgi:hypothetical protein